MLREMDSSFKQGSWSPQNKPAPAKSLDVMCKSEMEAPAFLGRVIIMGLLMTQSQLRAS